MEYETYKQKVLGGGPIQTFVIYSKNERNDGTLFNIAQGIKRKRAIFVPS